MEDRAADKAIFCLATGVQPSEYDNLNQYEIDAFVKAVKKRNSK